MKYFLTSKSCRVTEDLVTHLGFSPKGKKLVFIDTAAEVYNKNEADWLHMDRDALTDVGFVVTDYTLTDKTKEEVRRELNKYDVIFMVGGNTFYLMEKIKQSGFDELIQSGELKSEVYIGSSAGSIVLCRDLELLKQVDPAKDTSTTQGMGIVPFLILPHWGRSHFAERYSNGFENIYKDESVKILLRDNQYLLFENGATTFFTVDRSEE